jgi:YHS domain-containing protein
MRWSLIPRCVDSILALVLGFNGALAAPPERTLTLDPIELVAGREVSGKGELAIFHEGIEYHFATDANKLLFERDPAKFEVADGGACGRMGPLSGLGDARRFAVHEGRIYFFASDGCRAGFLKDPAAYIETADPMPFGSNEQVLQGRATLDKLVAWAGGADPFRKLTAYQASSARIEKQGETEWRVTHETAIAFPRRYYQKDAWNESWYSTASSDHGGVMATATHGAERIAASRHRAFERAMARWPVVIIKAHVDGSQGADCPGLVVISDGESTVNGVEVEHVKVWLNGAASRLTVEKQTGKPLSIAYRGRDGSMRVGDVVRTFTHFQTVDAITLPTAYAVTLDGKDLPRAGVTLDAFTLNRPIEPDRFKVSSWTDGQAQDNAQDEAP